MKGINNLLLLIIGLISLSCTYNDVASEEVIIGEWVKIKYVEVFEDGTEDVWHYKCEFDPKAIVSPDRTVEFKHNCLLGTAENDDLEVVGNWEKLDNGTYQINYQVLNSDKSGSTDSIYFSGQNTMNLIYNTGYKYRGKYFTHVRFEYVRDE